MNRGKMVKNNLIALAIGFIIVPMYVEPSERITQDEADFLNMIARSHTNPPTPEQIKHYLERGVDPNIAFPDGHPWVSNTPLLYLISSYKANRLPAIAYLINHPKIDLNKGDSTGATPLMAAVSDPDVLQLLLKMPALDILKRDQSGVSAVDIARKRGLTDCVDLLQRKADLALNRLEFRSIS